MLLLPDLPLHSTKYIPGSRLKTASLYLDDCGWTLNKDCPLISNKEIDDSCSDELISTNSELGLGYNVKSIFALLFGVLKISPELKRLADAVLQFSKFRIRSK